MFNGLKKNVQWTEEKCSILCKGIDLMEINKIFLPLFIKQDYNTAVPPYPKLNFLQLVRTHVQPW